MRSGYLATASAALVCGAALATAHASEPAEEIRYDALGNMIWESAAAAKEALPSLSPPDFSRIDVAGAEAALLETLAQAEDGAAELVKALQGTLAGALNSAKHAAEEFVSKGKVVIEGISYDKLVHPAFPEYALRVTSQPGLRGVPSHMREQLASKGSFCDPDVYSVSGYLDISESKHLWFVFFESRSNPKKDPLVLWLNGGPGCSSSTGLLFELGPCSIHDESSTVPNKHSWTNSANMIFLDQPASGVGFSYSEEGTINNTPAAAEDVYAFLQLFMAKFPKYASLPFHIAGESYAGTYIPQFAANIHEQNKKVKSSSKKGELLPIHLESVLIGNGLTSPALQFPSVYDFACGEDSQYRIFDPASSQCTSLKGKVATCKSLIESCYKYNSAFTCTPASLYCWSSYSVLQSSGLNLYDVRRTCDRDPSKDGPLCYKQMEWIQAYMNRPEIKSELGVPASVDFQSCNTQVNQAFLLHGDAMHNSGDYLGPLLDDGIRVLIYAGAADAMCNSIGNYQWVQALNSTRAPDFAAAKEQRWLVNGKDTGFFRTSAGKGSSVDASKHRRYKSGSGEFGDFAFVEITRAGHMVPADQPAESLEMFTRWLQNKALDSK